MKTISRFKALLLAIILALPFLINAQDDFYDLNAIQEIEISFTQSNWDYIMDTAKAGSGSYLMAQWVKINGIQFDSAGVKYKGSSSYDPAFAKNPLHISLDEFRNQSYLGITSIKLANFYGDPSMIREPLAYWILSNYMDCPRSNFATVSINGNLIGLYSNDESVNKKFCSTHFYSSGNTFIKGSPVLPGPYSKSNLKYISADSSAYFGKYELESDYGWSDLAELCDIITNLPSALSTALDIDRVLWMLAFNNVLVSLDSYSGWFSQNHYLYKDNTGHFNPIIWDLNMAFGGFPFAGTQNGGSGSLTVDQMKQLSPLLHDNHSDWPLVYNIMSNPLWKRMYLAHMRSILNISIESGIYQSEAFILQDLVADAVQADPNKFFTLEQFENGMVEDVQFGSYMVPGIASLMEDRAAYLLSAPEFSTEPPVITNVQPDDPEPQLGDEIYVTATVTGQGELNVYLGVRHNREDKFLRQPMYDDGNHNDGNAGDHVYGAMFSMTSLATHYYIYAETDEANIFAARFAPEFAEFGFYSLEADIPTAQPGDVVINEFLARNVTDTVNEYGNHEDWIELVNLTGQPVDLYGLYLTDDYGNPDKYAFPENTIIQPGSFLVIWADEEDTVSSYLHANFKLSADGEVLMLSDGAGLILDSLTFGPQMADISWGRCPDGAGLFDELDIPTFGFENYCPEGYPDLDPASLHVRIVPNPCQDRFILYADISSGFYIELYNTSGLKVFREFIESAPKSFPVSAFSAGFYFYLLKDEYGRILSSGKILKL